jgi:PilZ domain
MLRAAVCTFLALATSGRECIMEHRWGQRMRVDLPIRIKGQSFRSISARLIDLSLTGGFIEVELDVRLLCRFQVVAFVSGHFQPAAMSFDAHVIRKAHRGIGVEWAALSPADFRRLLRFAFEFRSAQQRYKAANAHRQYLNELIT